MIAQLQSFLHQEIPITKQMGLKLISFEKEKLQLKAPLDLNINDKGSVFGGSSSSLMIIAAWSLIKLNCKNVNLDADIVIHKNQTTWNKALYQDLNIQAHFEMDYDFNKIKVKLNNKRHQRINCFIKLIGAEDNIFSTMEAKYVIIPKK